MDSLGGRWAFVVVGGRLVGSIVNWAPLGTVVGWDWFDLAPLCGGLVEGAGAGR